MIFWSQLQPSASPIPGARKRPSSVTLDMPSTTTSKRSQRPHTT